MRRYVLLLPLVLWVAACGPDPDDPALTPTVGEADVERFRAEVFLETMPLDADLTKFEDEIGAMDSVTAAAYGPVLEHLRDLRRRMQVRVDTLSPMPQALFDTTIAGIREQAKRIRGLLDRAPLTGAPDVKALQATASRLIADISAGAAALRGIAREDTTGKLLAGLDSLSARSNRLQSRFRAYPDTSETEFPPFRETIVRDALKLRGELRQLTPDSMRTSDVPFQDQRRASGSSTRPPSE